MRSSSTQRQVLECLWSCPHNYQTFQLHNCESSFFQRKGQLGDFGSARKHSSIQAKSRVGQEVPGDTCFRTHPEFRKQEPEKRCRACQMVSSRVRSLELYFDLETCLIDTKTLCCPWVGHRKATRVVSRLRLARIPPNTHKRIAP